MKATIVLVAALLTFGGAGRAARADDDPLATALRKVVEEAETAYDREDLEGFMRHVHTKSPHYQKTRERLAKQFANLDVSTSVTEFRLIGHDDEFAVVRLKLKTTSDDPDFENNAVDQMALFHQENGIWKLWGDYEIGIELLPRH